VIIKHLPDPAMSTEGTKQKAFMPQLNCYFY